MRSQALQAFYKNRHCLITGGMGFIGSNLAITLVKLGAKVTIIDALIPGLGGNRFNIEPVKSHIKLFLSNLSNLSHLGEILRKQDLIFNLAGTHSHIDSMKDPIKDNAITCEAQLTLLETCRKYKPNINIIMAGTRSQYGKPLYLPVDEDHPLNPIDINAAHWQAVENYHFLYQRVYGIKTCSLRLPNTFGPRHNMQSPYQGIASWFIRLVSEGKPVTLYGDGMQKRDVIYIDDVCHAFLMAGASKSVWGDAYNLGGYPLTLKELAKIIIRLKGDGKIVYKPFPKAQTLIEPGDYVASWKKIHKELGWEPKVSLEEGLRKTLSYYKKYKKYYW